MKRKRKNVGVWRGRRIAPGERADLGLTVSRSYGGEAIRVPVHVWRAPEPGPSLFVTGAVHGDEVNGTGTIRQLILEPPFELRRGTLILVPVVNILAFERMSRYSPDRRDLNRSFPGLKKGSLTSRLAHVIYSNIVSRYDYGIDLHTAALRRTNYPNVRADMEQEATARLATLFGAELIDRHARAGRKPEARGREERVRYARAGGGRGLEGGATRGGVRPARHPERVGGTRND